MKADHPRAIDRYIDFFGEGTCMTFAALDTRTPPVADSPTVEPSGPGACDGQPRR
jgi:hypothetical protein